MDLLTRVTHLELRLLALEGEAHEYHHAKVIVCSTSIRFL